MLHDLQNPTSARSWLKSQTVFATFLLGSSLAAQELAASLSQSDRIVGLGDRAIPGFNWLSFAEYDGATAMVHHLKGLGHSGVTFVTTEVLALTPRRDGWLDAIDSDTSTTEIRIIGTAPMDAYQEGRAIARRGDLITAVFCANDQIALPLMAGLRDGGKVIPRDISVAGFDNHPLAPFGISPLTTIRQDFFGLGRLAVRLVETHEFDTGASLGAVLPTRLVERTSTGRAPVRAR